MSIDKEIYQISRFLHDTLYTQGADGFVLGMSGGIDSAVCAAIAKMAINPTLYKSHIPRETKPVLDLVAMPIGNPQEDLNIAMEVANHIGVELRTLDLGATLESFLGALHPNDHGAKSDVKRVGNLKARLRMAALYYAANSKNLLVLGTDNLSETYTGYFTKHGDGAADVFPIAEYTKREIFEIGRNLGLPDSVLNRPPSAGLWEGQTDEGEMGLPYSFIDNHLEGLNWVNKMMFTVDEYHAHSEKLFGLHMRTQHKRNPPIVYNREKK